MPKKSIKQIERIDFMKKVAFSQPLIKSKKKASYKQKLYMKNHNIDFSPDISAKDAWNKIFRFKNFTEPSGIELPEVKQNLASSKLIDYAKKLGIDVPANITTQDLRELIDERNNQ